jgi:hypothetical protein
VDELVTGINIALGSASVDACPGLDTSADGAVTIEELVRAIGNALGSCVNQISR